MNDKFLKAVGLAVVVFTVIALGGTIAHIALESVKSFINWLMYNIVPATVVSAFVGGLIYSIWSAATK